MRVLVVGSSRDLPDHTAQLQQAANELGAELARRGHTVVVGSQHPDDVDPYVVEGALQQGANGVEVHVPHGMAEPYPDKEAVQIRRHQFPDWDVTVMEVVRDHADAVLALGGRLGVIQAALSAWVLGKAVVSIGSFAGGAKKVWDYGSARRTQFYFNGIGDADIDRLAGPWGKAGSGPNAKIVVDMLERVSKASGIARTSYRKLAQVFLILLVALAGWISCLLAPTMLYSPDPAVAVSLPPVAAASAAPPSTAPPAAAAPEETPPIGPIGLVFLFACVASAGVVGTMVQTLRAMRLGEQVNARQISIDLFLGLAAGIISLVLYLIAQAALTGQVALGFTASDYVRVALIVSTASLFTAAYLDQALSRFDRISESGMKGEFGE